MLTSALTLMVLLQKSPSGDFLAQIKKDMIPLTTTDPTRPLNDLAAMGKLLKGVKVVGMGEATHGTSEFFAMKHRMFRYLVEEQGFTVFGLEASMPDCMAMDDYVLNGKGDPKAAVSSQGFWTWTTQEVLDLIKWMRSYNIDPKHKKKLRVVGYDMQSQVGCTLYFEDKEKELKGETDSNYWEKISWEPLSEEERSQAKSKLDDLVKFIKLKRGEEEGRQAEFVERVFFQSETNTWVQALRALQMKVVPNMHETFNTAANLITSLKLTEGPVYDALIFIDAHKNKLVDTPKEKDAVNRELWTMQAKAIRELSKGQKDSNVVRLNDQADLMDFLVFATTIPDIFRKPNANMLSYRDECMATNIVEITNKLLPNQKMMAWAHNGHIMRANQGGQFKSMGHFLNASIGKAYFPIGFAFDSGSFNAFNGSRELVVHEVKSSSTFTLDAILGQAGPALFFSPTKSGFGKFGSRSIGALYNKDYEDRGIMNFDPWEAYAGLIFVKKTTPTKLLK